MDPDLKNTFSVGYIIIGQLEGRHYLPTDEYVGCVKMDTLKMVEIL